MQNINILSDNILSPLGVNTQENWQALLNGQSGLNFHAASEKLPFDYCASTFGKNEIERLSLASGLDEEFTRLEKICILSILESMQRVDLDLSSQKVGFIVSTTKGNVDLLNNNDRNNERRFLSNFAKNISTYFKNTNQPIVISNACISGVLAIVTAKRLLRQQVFDHIVVVGADLVTTFTLSGFNALKALSAQACRPFDQDRKGINLGEAAATMIISARGDSNIPINIKGGSISNDANHISGPSRTGEGMIQVIRNALNSSKETSAKDLDFISTHGTATLYNDEMEAIALNHFDLGLTPANSFKSYYGHTLGAAGLIESILGYKSLLKNTLIASKGFEKKGTSVPLNIIEDTRKENSLRTCLKTASGFGGCNAAVIFEKRYE